MEETSEDSSDHDISQAGNDVVALSKVGQAEVALVVLLFNYMNRTVSAVLGEEMSTSMFSVPPAAARKMEGPRMMSIMNKVMAPFLSKSMKAIHKQGITKNLFGSASSDQVDLLPYHLQGVELAGMERANAVARLFEWVRHYEEQLLEKSRS